MKTRQPKIAKETLSKERQIAPIFGIPIDSTRKAKVLSEIQNFVKGTNSQPRQPSGQPRLVVTPNPEILLRSLEDIKLAHALRSADLKIPDGIGVLAALKYLSLPTPGRDILIPFVLVFQGLSVGYSVFFNKKWLLGGTEVVPGRAIFKELLDKSAITGWKIFLLGGKPGIAETIAQIFTKGKARILAESGPWLDETGTPIDEKQKQIQKKTIQKINAFKPHLLFVAFGPPKQEKWLSKNLPKLNVRVAMVVGGAFDYLGGLTPLPPVFVEKAGLEWLWRLITQPRRLPRVLNAIVVFPWEVFKWRLKLAKKQITKSEDL